MGKTHKNRLIIPARGTHGVCSYSGSRSIEQVLNYAVDGYQNPDTSSSRDASALAAYDWLDFAIATDSE